MCFVFKLYDNNKFVMIINQPIVTLFVLLILLALFTLITLITLKANIVIKFRYRILKYI